MKGGRIVVTGATGFTGPFVIRALRDRFPDAEIRCLVRDPLRASRILDCRVELFCGDLRDIDSLRTAFEDADTLVNVASLGFNWNESLFAAVAGSGLERGVFVSTTAILTRLPVRSRHRRQEGEALVRGSALRWTIVRPTMIYGAPGDRNIERLIKFVERFPVLPVVAPAAMQQPVHVKDVAAAIASALTQPVSIGQVYNIAGKLPLTLEEMVRTVVRVAGLRRVIVRIPSAPVRAGVSLMGRVMRNPFLTVEQIDRLHEDKAFDYAEAARDLNYTPRSFEDGLRGELELLRSQ